MRKIKLKDIKNSVVMGISSDITNLSFDDCEKIKKSHNLDVVCVSHNSCGMNGALLKDVNTGELFAITARNSTLFYFV